MSHEGVFERILKSAKNVLRDRSRLTVRAVADDAGISPGTVTYYFRSVPQLIHELGRGYFARGQHVLEGLRSAVDTAVVEREVRGAVQHAFDNAAYLRTVDRDADAARSEHRARLREHPALNGSAKASRQRKAMALLFMLGIDELACLSDEELIAWSGAASIDEAKTFLADTIAHAATVVYFAEPPAEGEPLKRGD